MNADILLSQTHAHARQSAASHSMRLPVKAPVPMDIVTEPKKESVAAKMDESVDLNKTLPLPSATVEPEKKRRRTEPKNKETEKRDETKKEEAKKEEAKKEEAKKEEVKHSEAKKEIATKTPEMKNDVRSEVDSAKTVEEQVRRIMEDPEKQKPYLERVDQSERRYARLVSFQPPITIALLNTQPLVCGRERSEGDAEQCNFLEIGALTLHKRAVSRKHFTITYDADLGIFFIEVISKNGLFLDGHEYHDGRHPLRNGSSISVQHFTMYFDVPEQMIPPSTFYGSKN